MAELNFKVGDAVEIISEDCCGGAFPVGTIGEVEHVFRDRLNENYRVAALADFWFYCDNCLASVPAGTPVTKAELMITITRKKYDELVEASTELSYLNMAGVDNWDGCSLAYEMRQEEEGK